jgi:hypothetical protein
MLLNVWLHSVEFHRVEIIISFMGHSPGLFSLSSLQPHLHLRPSSVLVAVGPAHLSEKLCLHGSPLSLVLCPSASHRT